MSLHFVSSSVFALHPPKGETKEESKETQETITEEEAKELFEEQLAKEKEEALRQAQEELAKKEEEARQEALKQLEELEKKEREEALKKIEEEKRKAEEQFQKELEEKKREQEKKYRKQIEQQIHVRLRETGAAGWYPSPKEIAKARQTAVSKVQEELSRWEQQQREAFYEHLAQWESEQLATLEEQLKAWREEQLQNLEEQISSWKSEVWNQIVGDIQSQEQQIRKQFEAQLEEAKIEVKQPEPKKSLAQQIIELPSLNLFDWIAGALGFKESKEYRMWKFQRELMKETVPDVGYELSKGFVAGIVGVGESFVYSIADIGGFMIQGLGDITGWYEFEYSPEWHPIPPPTILGAGVSSAIESGISLSPKASFEAQQLGRMYEEKGIATVVGYGIGSVVGEILLAKGLTKAGSLAKKGISKGVSLTKTQIGKAVGYLEKSIVPEHYFYYKAVLQKPMLRTMLGEFAEKTFVSPMRTFARELIKPAIGEEAYYFLTKIGIRKPVVESIKKASKVVSSSSKALYHHIRRSVLYGEASPFSEIYVYAKYFGIPKLKEHFIPSLRLGITGTFREIKRGLLYSEASPFSEVYVYSKYIGVPMFKRSLSEALISMRGAVRRSIMESVLGEAYIYGKAVVSPKLAERFARISLPSLPSEITSSAKAVFGDIKGAISELKLYTKAALGKKYILPLARKKFKLPMKPFVFETKREASEVIKKVVSGKSFALTIGKETTKRVSPSALKMYVPVSRAIMEEVEEVIYIHYPHEKLGKPEAPQRLKKRSLAASLILGSIPAFTPRVSPSHSIMAGSVQLQGLKQPQLSKQILRQRAAILQQQRLRLKMEQQKKRKPKPKPLKVEADIFGYKTAAWEFPVAAPLEALNLMILGKKEISRKSKRRVRRK